MKISKTQLQYSCYIKRQYLAYPDKLFNNSYFMIPNISAAQSESFPWTLTPVSSPNLAIFDMVEGSDKPYRHPFTLLCSISLFLALAFTFMNLYGLAILSALVFFISVSIPQAAQHIRRTKTQYEIYPDRIEFNLYESFEEETKTLPLNLVDHFSVDRQRKGIGHILIHTRSEPPFKTATLGGRTRSLPAFENIPDCESVCEKLNQLLISVPKEDKTLQDPIEA